MERDEGRECVRERKIEWRKWEGSEQVKQEEEQRNFSIVVDLVGVCQLLSSKRHFLTLI